MRLALPASLSRGGRIPLVAVLPLVALLPACVPAGDPPPASCGVPKADCSWSSGNVAGFALPLIGESRAGPDNSLGTVLGFYLEDCSGSVLGLHLVSDAWAGVLPTPGTYAIETLSPSVDLGNGPGLWISTETVTGVFTVATGVWRVELDATFPGGDNVSACIEQPY